MNKAITSYEDYESIIIDTDGCSQRNEKKLLEMREFFDERGRIHNYLVLSATSKDIDLNEVTRKFGSMPIDSIIFTKLDESATYGSLFNHAIDPAVLRVEKTLLSALSPAPRKAWSRFFLPHAQPELDGAA